MFRILPRSFRSSSFLIHFLQILFYAALAGLSGYNAWPQAVSAADSASAPAMRHSGDEWQLIAPHLPDPHTASAAELQQAGDVLRARRFLPDALDYYHFAMERGGNQVVLLNRIGVTELQLNQLDLARACFRRVVTMRRGNAEAWNNLGATESIAGHYADAISDYRKAVKLNRGDALFHANLGTVYLAEKDTDSARAEFEKAVDLDPNVFQRGGFGGSQVHILGSDDRGEFSFEMARLAAMHHEEDSMLHWLARASEAGINIAHAMQGQKEFAVYANDPRIATLIQNSQSMRFQQVAARGALPTLPEPKP